MSWKLLKDLFLWLLVLAALSSAAALSAVLLVNGTEGFRAWWATGSQTFFQRFIEDNPFAVDVFRSSFYAFAVVAAVIQLKVSRHAMEISNSFSHLNEFKEFVKSEINLFSEIDKDSVSISKLHSVFFPEMSVIVSRRRGWLGSRTELASNTAAAIDKVRQYVKEEHQRYALPDTNEFSCDAHQAKMRTMLATVGIEVDELPSERFWKVEDDVIRFLNRMMDWFYPDAERIIENPAYR